jgi:hypothetical protein
MKTYAHLWQYLSQFFSEWDMFQTKVVKIIKTHISHSITFFLKSCRLWDNVEKYGTARQSTDGSIIRRMRFACWITKATDTHLEYVILCFPMATMVMRTRLNNYVYMYAVSLFRILEFILSQICKKLAHEEEMHLKFYASTSNICKRRCQSALWTGVK